MKEVTMVTTCEITAIANVSDEDVAMLQANLAKAKRMTRKQIESDLGADNVFVNGCSCSFVMCLTNLM